MTPRGRHAVVAVSIAATISLIAGLLVALPLRGRAHRGAPRAVATGSFSPSFSPSVPARSTLLPRARKSPPKQAARPNIVFILTDDETVEGLEVMPNVHRLLAEHGVLFDNAFVTTSLCCPSRASILTGEYSRHTGVYDNSPPNGGVTAFNDDSTIATWIHHAGYRTGYVGRYLNGYESLGAKSFVPPGWDDWRGLATVKGPTQFTLNENGHLVNYGPDPSDYLTYVIQRRAIDFIRAKRGPFFLNVGTLAPHFPTIPAAEDAGSFANAPAYRPASFDEADVSDKPWGASVPPMTVGKIQYVDLLHRNTFETLLAVDRMVAAIVHELDRRKELDNTVIAFASDNGFLWGEHRLIGKIWPYEKSIRVPLIFRAPWISKGRVDHRFALNVDLASTFAQLAGAKVGLPQDGRSLVPLLRGDRVSWRSDFLIEYLGSVPGFEPIPAPRFEGVRTDRYKLIVYHDGTRELYDLVNDPDEMRSVAGDPAYRAIEADLNARLHRLLS